MALSAADATPLRRRPPARPGRLALAALCAALGLAIALARPGGGDGFLGAFEARLIDLRFAARGTLPAPEGVAIIAIDDEDIARIGRFPPPRDALARAVEAATRAGAASVAVDMLLIDETPEDGALASALARNGRAALGAASSGAAGVSGAPPSDAVLAASVFAAEIGAAPGAPDPLVGPAPALAAEARLGHVAAAVDADGGLRRLPAFVTVETAQGAARLPGLAFAALAAAARERPLLRLPSEAGAARVEIGDAAVPLDRRASARLVFYGAGGAIPTWPLREAETADLAGRIVFVGAAATGFGDWFATPFDLRFPGVETHATLAANALEGRALLSDGPVALAGAGLAALAAAAAFAAASREAPAVAAGATAATATAVALAAQGAFLGGWLFDASALVLALALGGSAGFAARLIEHRRRAANLARYQSPLLAETLARDAAPAFDGRAQSAAALFVDVAGYTARSEALGAAGSARFVRAFHAAVERSAIAHRGVVEQFAGDGAMILFGLPDPGPRDAADALACVEALFAETADLGAGEGPQATIRVGAHFGGVEAGLFGGARQRHVTVTGDVVNTASRLQELAKKEGAAVAISTDLLDASGAPGRWRARLGLRPLGRVALRGRAAALDAWAGGPPGGAGAASAPAGEGAP